MPANPNDSLGWIWSTGDTITAEKLQAMKNQLARLDGGNTFNNSLNTIPTLAGTTATYSNFRGGNGSATSVLYGAGQANTGLYFGMDQIHFSTLGLNRLSLSETLLSTSLPFALSETDALIRKTSNAGTLTLTGDSGTSGGNIHLRGSTHPDHPNTGLLRSGSEALLSWNTSGVEVYNKLTAPNFNVGNVEVINSSGNITSAARLPTISITGKTSGTLTVARGGTGQTTLSAAMASLGAERTITAGDGLTGGGTLAADRSFAVDDTVVRTSRTIDAGDGLTGGGNLSGNRAFAVDSTVVRTSGNQTIWGTKTFGNELVMSSNNIRSHNNTSALNLFGSDSFNKGAGIWLRGENHPTEPGIGSLRSNGLAVAHWDDDGFHVNNSSNVMLTSGNQVSSGTKTFENIRVSSNGWYDSPVIGRDSTQGIYFANGGVSFAHNSTYIATFQSGTDATTGLKLPGFVFSNGDSGTGGISGGSASNSGGNIILYGNTHSSTPNRGVLRSGSTQIARWDSGGFHVHNSSNVVLTSGNQSMSGTKTFTGTLRIPVV